MIVEIVTTGSELLLGQIVNTNAAYIARELNKVGFDVCYQSTVGDNRPRMRETFKHALSRADIVIASGGLGPTRGDITKEVAADIFGREMRLDEGCAARLRAQFAKMNREMTENNLRQAMIPLGAKILVNHAGTAPGIVLENLGKCVALLPGPPSEMKDMLHKSLLPYLRERYGFSSATVSRVLNTSGIGESMLETKIDDLILAQKNPTLALLVRPEGVIIRITAKAATEDEARRLIAPVEKEIRSRVGDYIYAADDEELEKIVGRLLRERALTVALAESCTGGLLASRLTDVAGSSGYVRGGIVSYTNAVKEKSLGVLKSTLDKKGAVSEETAWEMAEGARERLGADIGVGITGLAGPEGDEGKPVGLVWIAVAGPRGITAGRHMFGGDRRQIKFRATQAALHMIKNFLERN